ncbi:hypothetical protein [Chamaesiphon polymorphus]|nr:hypothetical protein [Chamaesiphon polymorphus]
MWEEKSDITRSRVVSYLFIGQYLVSATLECIAEPELICVDRQEEYFLG